MDEDRFEELKGRLDRIEDNQTEILSQIEKMKSLTEKNISVLAGDIRNLREALRK